MVMPVFKRSITASRSTQNYQILLRTFGDTLKSVNRTFHRKLQNERVFQQKERNTQISCDYFGKTHFTLLGVAPKVINENWNFLMLREAVMLLLKTGITSIHIQSYVF